MISFIVSVTAKDGHEDQVADFYRGIGELQSKAPGFGGRHIYRARTGAMVKAVLAGMSEEDRDKHSAGGHGGHGDHATEGTQFVIIEQWASIDDRMAFASGAAASRTKELVPHLLPVHSHEFFEEVV